MKVYTVFLNVVKVLSQRCEENKYLTLSEYLDEICQYFAKFINKIK